MAEQFGTLKDHAETGGDDDARRAIEYLIGEDTLRQAVEYYISGGPGSELTRAILMVIRPWSAMRHCYDIYKSDPDIVKRRLAVELLRVVADDRAAGWITEFLGDQDQEVQMWGAGLLEQLHYSRLISEQETEALLETADNHPNPNVRELAASIRRRSERAET